MFWLANLDISSQNYDALNKIKKYECFNINNLCKMIVMKQLWVFRRLNKWPFITSDVRTDFCDLLLS